MLFFFFHGQENVVPFYCSHSRNEGTVDLHFAYRQSIIDFTISSLFFMEKFIKLVSTSI